MANISTRALCGTGGDIVIAGFILGNNGGDDRVVLRGIGPSLAAFGVPNVLADPVAGAARQQRSAPDSEQRLAGRPGPGGGIDRGESGAVQYPRIRHSDDVYRRAPTPRCFRD